MSPDLSRFVSRIRSAEAVVSLSRPERERVAFPVAFLSSSQSDADATDTPRVYTRGVAFVVAPFRGGSMPTPTLAARPVTVRADSVADLPDPDQVAAVVDEAAAADPRRVKELLSDPEAELDVWRHVHGWTVWIGDAVLWRTTPEEKP